MAIIKTLIIGTGLLFISYLSNAQEVERYKVGTFIDQLDDINLSVLPSANLTTLIKQHKRELRRAARISKGDYTRFIQYLNEADVPIKKLVLNKQTVIILYHKANLLTLSGKIEELPSVL